MIVFIDGPVQETAKDLFDRIVSDTAITSDKDIHIIDDINDLDLIELFNEDIKGIAFGSPIGMMKTDYAEMFKLVQSNDYVYSFVIINVPKQHEDIESIKEFNMHISESMMFLNDPLKQNKIQYQFNANEDKIFKGLVQEIVHYFQINN